MKINRRDFLKSLALAVVGLFGWRLPIPKQESPKPVPESGMWCHACSVWTKDADRRASMDGRGLPFSDDSDCIRDLQGKVGRAARLSFEKGIRGRRWKGWEKDRLASCCRRPSVLRRVGLPRGLTSKEIADVETSRWDLYKPLPRSLVRFYWLPSPVNDDHPLAEGLVGVGLPDGQGGLDWWQRRTDKSEWEHEHMGD